MRPVFWASGTSGCVLGKGDLLHLTLGNEPESKTDIVIPQVGLWSQTNFTLVMLIPIGDIVPKDHFESKIPSFSTISIGELDP